jgi:hypothetical protein
MDTELCQHCHKKPILGVCSRCQNAGFCSQGCLAAAFTSRAHCAETACAKLGADGAGGSTDVLPSHRTTDQQRVDMERRLRAQREEFRLRDRQGKIRTAMLDDFQNGLGKRERALTQTLFSEVDHWAAETQVQLAVTKELPSQWNSAGISKAVRDVAMRARAVGASWKQPAEMTRHLGELENQISRFQTLVGVPSDGPTMTRDQRIHALANQTAREIVQDAALKAEEYVRIDDEAMAFGFPPEDVEPAHRRTRATSNYRAREEELQAQIQSARNNLANAEERTFFDQLVTKSLDGLRALPEKLRGWASVHALSVAYGLAMMTITGVFLYGGGYLALRLLRESQETIVTSAETIREIAPEGIQTVQEAQNILHNDIEPRLANAAAVLSQSKDIWMGIGELPANEKGIEAAGHILNQWRTVAVENTIKAGFSLSDATRKFDDLSSGTFATFDKLVRDYRANKFTEADFGAEWRLTMASMRATFGSSSEYALEQLRLMQESLLAFRAKLASIGQNFATVAEEADKIKKASGTLNEQLNIHLGKAPFSAHIMNKIGAAMGAGPKIGAAAFYASDGLLKLMEIESYVRVLTGGVDELLVDGIGAVLTNTVILSMVQRTAAVMGIALSGALRGIAGSGRLVARLGALASRLGEITTYFRGGARDAPEISVTPDTPPSWWRGVEDFLNHRATDVENAMVFITAATSGWRTLINLRTIAVSTARLLWMLVAWCTAWQLAVAVAVGAAAYLVITRALAVSPKSIAAYTARMLLGYHWMIAPALGSLVALFSLYQGVEAPSFVGDDELPKPEITSLWANLSSIRNSTDALIQKSALTISEADLSAVKAELATNTHWIFSHRS